MNDHIVRVACKNTLFMPPTALQEKAFQIFLALLPTAIADDCPPEEAISAAYDLAERFFSFQPTTNKERTN